MFRQSDILDEKKSKILRQKSKKVTFPLSEEDKFLINDMIMYLRLSQDEEYASKNNIRAGMGLAAVQLGVLKRFFVISYKNDDGTFEEYRVINPEIISNSEELIYVEEGEGCLSVNRYVEGIVPRFARITVKFYDEEGNEVIKRVREEIAVAFQHEIDHLNGIMFVDKIDPKNPFKNQENMRAI
ncbi:MAG: peptide deformylase [Tenericutes bacterium]|nr:peptide deformylase [Mycoplasmatota bacterium]